MVAIATVFAPWFQWQRGDRGAEASWVYDTTNLFRLMPSPNYPAKATSGDSVTTVDAIDSEVGSRVGWLGRLIVLVVLVATVLRSRSVDSHLVRGMTGLGVSVFVIVVMCSCANLMWWTVRPTDLAQDEFVWKLSALSWIGPGLLMVSSSMAALIWVPSPVRTLRWLLLIELGLAVVLWFSPTLLKTGLTLWSSVFLPPMREGQEFHNPARQLAFVSNRSGNREIYLIGADRTGLVNLTHHGSDDFAPSWSHDGQRIAFVSDRGGNLDVFTMKADGSDLLRLTDAPSDDFAPAWSPDGQRIVFTSNQTGQNQVHIVPSSGGSPIQVTQTEHGAFYPLWQPDSGDGYQRVIFEQCVGGGETDVTVYKEIRLGFLSSSVFASQPEPAAVSQVIGCAQQQCPSLTTRNGMVAFMSDRTYNFEVFQAYPERNLTRHPANDICPSLSSDGELLAFASQRDGNWEIYLTEMGSSNVIRLTYSLAVDTAPAWRP